eukprot:8532772-Pyramimonas_sp.AAC.1
MCALQISRILLPAIVFAPWPSLAERAEAREQGMRGRPSSLCVPSPRAYTPSVTFPSRRAHAYAYIF